MQKQICSQQHAQASSGQLWRDRDLMKQVQKVDKEENEAKDEFERKYDVATRVK